MPVARISCLMYILTVVQAEGGVKELQKDEYIDQVIAIHNESSSGSFTCEQKLEMCQMRGSSHEFSFSLYKKLEASLINNPMLLHQLRQVFFPVTGTHIQEVGRAFFNVTISAGCLDEQKCCTSEFDRKNFRLIWTASPLMSMVTVDQLLIMDSLITARVYEKISTSMVDYRLLLPFRVYDLQCLPKDEEILQALVHLLSWVKAFARYDGKPVAFEERDKGYIVKYYNYYTTESLYKVKNHNHARKIRLVLLAIIACLNIIIPMGFALGVVKQLQIVLPDEQNKGNNGIKKAVAVTLVALNVLYIILRLSLIHSSSNSSLMECITTSGKHCIVPPHSTLYWDEAATMVVVDLLFPLAVVFELIIAIAVQLQTQNRQIKPKSVTYHCCNAFILWNAMVFAQILIGLILLPVVVFLVIAPADTISSFGCVGLIAIHIALTIKYLFFDGKCRANCKCCLLFFVKLLFSFILFLLLILLEVIYFELLEVGTSVQTLKGFVLPLVPSLILTMLAWFIRKKVLKNSNRNQSKATKFNLESISLEEHQSLLGDIHNVSEDESHMHIV